MKPIRIYPLKKCSCSQTDKMLFRVTSLNTQKYFYIQLISQDNKARWDVSIWPYIAERKTAPNKFNK